MEEPSDENLRVDGKVTSGESDEVMLSEPHSGEDSSAWTRDNEYGVRDDEAAADYVKRTTTTETEHEDSVIEEAATFPTSVPQPQVMDVQSNVVPAPVEIAPIQPPSPAALADDEGDSKRNSEEGVAEVSVGPPSVQADIDSEIEEIDHPDLDNPQSEEAGPEGAPSQPKGSSPSVGDRHSGSVRINEGEEGALSGNDSSLSFGHSDHDHNASSPVMFLSGGDQGAGSEPEQASSPVQPPVIRERGGLDPSDFVDIGRNVDPARDEATMKQTMEAMTDEVVEEEVKPTAVTVQKTTTPQLPERGPAVPAPRTSEGESSTAPAEREVGAARRGLPSLPPRKGMGPLSSMAARQSSGSTSSQTRTGPPPQQETRQTQQPRALPAVPGNPAGLPPLHNPQQPSRPQQQQPPRQPPSSSAEGSSSQRAVVAENGDGSAALTEPSDVVEARRKLINIRLLVLRIANRLGLKPLDFSITDFMAKIDRTEQLRFRGPGPIRPQLDALFNQAVQMDSHTGPDSNLDMTVTAIVLGPAGSGKSSVIRNLLHPGHGLAPDFAMEATEKITVHAGRIGGVRLRLIDTPGLSVAASALRKNMKILKGVRSYVSRYKPDAVIYVDRMDLFRRELSDIPLLRLVNDMLPDLLYNCIALLTRASAPPPDPGHGAEMPYLEYQRLRLDLCSQIITHALSDMRWSGRPLGFENHPNCALNDDDIPVLPSGQTFKRNALFQLILSHMSVQMEKVCKTKQLRRNTMERMLYIMQPRKQLQLSALVSQLLAPKPPKKFPDEERELLTKREISRLSSANEKTEEENKRRDYTRIRKVEILQEEAHPSQVPLRQALKDVAHHTSAARYNATDFVYGWSVRPIMSAQDNIFEHDDGVEMFQVAREGVLRNRGVCVDGVPASMIIQAGKGKNFGNVQMDTGVSYYPTRNVVTTVGAVVHPAGQDGEIVYTPTVDIRAKITDNDKLTLGGMACRLADNGWPHKGQLGLGGKLENKYKIKEGVKVLASAGAMTVKPVSSQPRDVAYGANLELKLAGGKGEYDPTFLFSGGVSHQRKGAFKRTGFSGQISGEQAISPETMLNGRLQLSAGGSGTASLRMITHDKPQSGWLMVVPLLIKAGKRLMGQGDEFV